MNPNLLILKENSGNRYFLVLNTDELRNIALKIIKERVKDGNWYLREDLKLAKDIIRTENKVRALNFLNNQQSYEYEELKIEEFENNS